MIVHRFKKTPSPEAMLEWMGAISPESKIEWHLKHTPWFTSDQIRQIVNMEQSPQVQERTTLSDMDMLYLLSKI